MGKQILGFVGIGRMGGPMAGRLLDAGYELCAYDAQVAAVAPLQARGVRIANSAQEVASEAEIVLVSLPTPDIVKARFARRARRHPRQPSPHPDRPVHERSGRGHSDRAAARATGDPRRRTGERRGGWRRRGHACRDGLMPNEDLRGGGADPEKFRTLVLTGEKPGLAQTAKLANNLLAAAALVVTSEAMAMGVKAGLNPQVLIDIINASSGRNSATQDKFPRSVLPGTFDFGFTTGLSYKDVRLCIDEAEAMNVPMVVGAAVRQMLAVTNAKFGPASDFTCVAKVLEEWAGVEIRG